MTLGFACQWAHELPECSNHKPLYHGCTYALKQLTPSPVIPALVAMGHIGGFDIVACSIDVKSASQSIPESPRLVLASVHCP
jgi:hypothetical protein